MPVAGRKPTANPRHRGKPAYEWTEVVNVAHEGGPKLGRRPNGKPWPRRTKAWWAAVSAMPHCVLWAPADWEYALDAAQLAAEFHEGDIRAENGLRAREKVMGTTVDYRRDLRIRYVDEPTEEAPAGVTNLDDYRDAIG